MTNIKLADNPDTDFLAKVCLDAAKKYDSILPGAFEKQAKKYNRDGLPTKYQVRTIISNSTQIGFLGFKEISQSTEYIVGLYLLSKYQNLGFGQKVLAEFEKFCQKKQILLLVHQSADWAISFYKKNGFIIVGTTKEEIIKYEEMMKTNYLPNTYLMSKKLGNDYL